MVIGNSRKRVKPFDQQNRIYTSRVSFIDHQLQRFAWVLVLINLEIALESPGQQLAESADEMDAGGNAIRCNPDHCRSVIAAVRRKSEIRCCPGTYRLRCRGLITAVGHNE